MRASEIATPPPCLQHYSKPQVLTTGTDVDIAPKSEGTTPQKEGVCQHHVSETVKSHTSSKMTTKNCCTTTPTCTERPSQTTWSQPPAQSTTD